MRSVVRDPDRLTEASHRLRVGENRIFPSADISKQVNAATVLRSMMGACNRVDQIDTSVTILVKRSQRFTPVAASPDNTIIDWTTIDEPQGAVPS